MTDRKSQIAKLLKAHDELKREVQARQRAEGEIRRNYDIQKVINALLELIGQDITFEELLRRSIDIILSIPWLAFESMGGIFLVEDDPEVLVLKAQKDFSESLQKTCREVPFGKCLCGKAALTQKIQFADRIDERHDIHYEGMSPHGHYCVPILYAGKTIGAISLYLPEGHSHDQKEENFLASAASTLAGLIMHKRDITEKRRAQEALQQAHNDLEAKVKERTAELTTTNENLEMEIAERKQAEAALKLSQEALSHAQAIAHMGHWKWDMVADVITGSDEFYRIFGTNQNNFSSLAHFRKILNPDDRDRVVKAVEAALKENKPYDIEYRIVCSDGKEKYIHAQGEISFDSVGNPVRMTGTAFDITERKQAEEELRISEEKLRSITTSAISAIIMMDANGKITFWNEAARKIFGWRAEEALGKDLHALLVSEQIQEASRKTLPLFRKTGQGKLIGKIVEHTAIRKSGEEVTIELSLSAVNIKGQWNAIGIVNDISMRKQAEATLQKAKDLAEAANKAKSDFLSSMSHELRTPLTAIIGFAEVLKDQYFGKLNDKQTDYVKDIFESGKHLLSLINDILDLSKVEAGKMELELSEINIRHLLEYSTIMIKEKALKHRIKLDIQIPEELSGLEIQADERQLKQVMFNLLANAAKFTPDGGAIEVEAKQVAQELIISVSDTGIGVAPEDQEKIFDEFYQVIGGKKDKTPGTGLGLTIAMRFVKMHGGRLWVESEGKNKGSRFCFTLPLRVAPPDARASETPMPEIYDDKTLLIHLNKIISLSLEENRVFSLCRFYFEMENLQEMIFGIKEVINRMKRANDLLGIDINNNLYLILQGTKYEEAKGVCDRIIQKIENMIEGLKISYSLASFPEDGKTPEALLGKLTFLIQ